MAPMEILFPMKDTALDENNNAATTVEYLHFSAGSTGSTGLIPKAIAGSNLSAFDWFAGRAEVDPQRAGSCLDIQRIPERKSMINDA